MQETLTQLLQWAGIVKKAVLTDGKIRLHIAVHSHYIRTQIHSCAVGAGVGTPNSKMRKHFIILLSLLSLPIFNKKAYVRCDF